MSSVKFNGPMIMFIHDLAGERSCLREMKARICPSGKLLCLWTCPLYRDSITRAICLTIGPSTPSIKELLQLGRYNPSTPSTKELQDWAITLLLTKDRSPWQGFQDCCELSDAPRTPNADGFDAGKRRLRHFWPLSRPLRPQNNSTSETTSSKLKGTSNPSSGQ